MIDTKVLLSQIGLSINIDLPQILGIALKASDVKKGFIFVALKGSQKDGADFIPEAIQNGAVLILAEHEAASSVPLFVVSDLRRKVSVLSTLIYPSLNLKKVAVTGTNGKTSTVFYVQQLLNKLGIKAASLGTIGIDFGDNHIDGSMTTPDAVTLNQTLQHLEEKGVQVVAMEASSHGLDQGRLDGLTLEAGAFTNLTQDHLDYHKTMDAYLEAKSNLFSRYIAFGKLAILNADDPCFEKLEAVAKSHQLQVVSYGLRGKEIKLLRQEPIPGGQKIEFEAFGKSYKTEIHIVGDFQVMNLFAAFGICLGLGVEAESLINLFPELQAPTGRIESMGTLQNGAEVFVDYAHTPDAVERVLTSLRAHTKGKLYCVLGCGGNRDTGKRPLMGAAAEKLADVVYITDDNPRFEDPASIRAAIKQRCPKGIEFDNREEAIHEAINRLEKEDVLVIAGKGHEPGQTINGVVYAMDDRVEARLAILRRQQDPIWNVEDLKLALSIPKLPNRIVGYGISMDTRTLKLGDLFIALPGGKIDAHTFVKKAVEKGAAACIVSHIVPEVPFDKQIVVSDTMLALESLAQFARMKSSARFIGITGSSGKTTTKEMLKACLSDQGLTHATAGNFNNQIGVPLTLASMKRDVKYAIIEMGMNHHGELIRLSQMVRPDVSIITSIGSAHREFFPTEQDVASAKSEIFEFQNRQGTVVLNRDCPFYDFLKKSAKSQGIQNFLSFGHKGSADFRVKSVNVIDNKTVAIFEFEEKEYTLKLNFLGTHFVMDALGVLAIVHALGGNLSRAISSLEKVEPAGGRGAAVSIQLESKRITLIDDTYNANPSSMKASIESLALREGKRKIAVLGDMLELGNLGPELHKGLKEALLNAAIDKVYVVGSLMHQLFTELPVSMQGKEAQKALDLVPILRQDLQDKDVVLIKASHGMGFSAIIQGLKGSI